MADYAVTSANVKPSALATIKQGIALEEITPGQPIYENIPFDGKFGLADANGALPSNNVAGVAVNHALAGQAVSYVEADPEFEHGLTGADVNTTLILSATPGRIAPDADAAAGWYKTVLGIVTSATKMNLSPIRSGVVTP